MLLCPVCHEPLVDDERGAACAGGHRFDRAREGYLYLLRSSKSGDSMGDPKSQARSRRDFLNRGYYAPLRDAMVELLRERAAGHAASVNGPMTLLDICCGEGYYTSAMGAVPGARHLFGLKEVLYDTPYLNDEKLPKTTELELVGTQRVSANITLRTQADIEAVFHMTPYYYRTRPADKERLANLDALQTDIDFIIAEYRH